MENKLANELEFINNKHNDISSVLLGQYCEVHCYLSKEEEEMHQSTMKVEMTHCDLKERFKETLLPCIIENMPPSLLQEMINDQESIDESSSSDEFSNDNLDSMSLTRSEKEILHERKENETQKAFRDIEIAFFRMTLNAMILTLNIINNTMVKGSAVFQVASSVEFYEK